MEENMEKIVNKYMKTFAEATNGETRFMIFTDIHRIGLFRTTLNNEETFDIVKFLENEWFVIRTFKRSRNAIEAYKALTKPETERSEDSGCPY